MGIDKEQMMNRQNAEKIFMNAHASSLGNV